MWEGGGSNYNVTIYNDNEEESFNAYNYQNKQNYDHLKKFLINLSALE